MLNGKAFLLALALLAASAALASRPDSTSTDPGARDSGSTRGPASENAGADSSSTRRGSPARPSRGDLEAGRKTFRQTCVPCHKADGSGGIKLTGNPTPDWRDSKRMADPKHDDAYLRDCITNGKPKSGMVAWSKQGMKPATIENLIAYIRTFSAKKPSVASPK